MSKPFEIKPSETFVESIRHLAKAGDKISKSQYLTFLNQIDGQLGVVMPTINRGDPIPTVDFEDESLITNKIAVERAWLEENAELPDYRDRQVQLLVALQK